METKSRPICMTAFPAPLMTLQIPNDPKFSSADHSTLFGNPQFENLLLRITMSHLFICCFNVT